MSNKPDKSSFLRAESELVLDLARQGKEKKIAGLGSPIKLKGQALDMLVRKNLLWVAENTGSVLVIDLNTNETISTFRCHQAPVTTLVFVDRVLGSGDEKIMITGSWDKTIKVWDTETKELVSVTEAHSDFVKALFVLPKCNLLVSASSDKVLRLWDLSNATGTAPLISVGSISAHTRPVEALGGEAVSDDSAILYSADTMGVLKIWLLERDTTQATEGVPPRWRATLREDLTHHRTRINQLVLHNGYIWTASADETVKIHPHTPEGQGDGKKRPIKPILHPTGVKALLPLYIPSLDETYLFTASGDVIKSWDTSDLDDKIEQRNEVDGHWHDVTLLKAWYTSPDLYIMSASLDGTIRRWKVKDLLTPKPRGDMANLEGTAVSQKAPAELTEEEERELDELMNDDD
ncbi:WD40 repeat-like protein [Thelephora terrestris]|uniref:WD40 repeat-like protein n=1 Tax=Thelephora terrestris TaxID=56493 RepID=A0A9P6LCS6_9AGAM|nr:WD40 repeat-like protein [Thelephora terrestris]